MANVKCYKNHLTSKIMFSLPDFYLFISRESEYICKNHVGTFFIVQDYKTLVTLECGYWNEDSSEYTVSDTYLED